MQNYWILILGANSDIAVASARLFAQEGANIWLASRNLEELEKEASNLRVRYGVEAKAVHFDARDFDGHQEFYAGLYPRPDGVVLAFGLLGNQQVSQKDFNKARAVLETNYLGAVSILEIVTADFESKNSFYTDSDTELHSESRTEMQAERTPEPRSEMQKKGFIVGISSVAGDRGRADNYMYGSSKAGFTAYLSGLRQRLHASGISVLTVKPGFVATKMTSGMPLPKLLTTDPDTVAKAILKGIRKQKNTIYVTFFWRLIMAVIMHIPERLFKRLKF